MVLYFLEGKIILVGKGMLIIFLLIIKKFKELEKNGWVI